MIDCSKIKVCLRRMLKIVLVLDFCKYFEEVYVFQRIMWSQSVIY